MLRYSDSETYEDWFGWLEAQENLLLYIQDIADLLSVEDDDLFMRSTLVELIGIADLEEYVPLLVQELTHQDRLVRSWAYGMLSRSEHECARAHAENYRQSHPNEDFY